MSRGHRTRLEQGIYQDASGLAAVVKVGALQREKRYPADTDRDVLRRWRAKTRTELLADQDLQIKQRADPRGFARSVAVYLRKRKGRPGAKSDRSHLKAWITRLGSKRRHLVTQADVEAAIAWWRGAHLSEATIRHRVRVLRELYQSLDGKSIAHPARDVSLPRIVRPAPIPVASSIIRKVADSLKAGLRHEEGYGDDPILSRARFLVYATTGQRPAQIGRALPGDVDLDRRVWFVRPAKGGDPIPLPLNDDMVAAWTVFIKANAWGRFSTPALAKLLRRHGWPAHIRPYMLRHTFAIDLLLSGADLGDVQGLLGHQSIQTTRQFYAPILIARLTQTVQKRRLGLEVPATPVPAAKKPRRHNTPQIASSRTRRRTRSPTRKTRKRL